MISCQVTYLDGKRSKTYQALLNVYDDEVRVHDLRGHCLERAVFNNISLSPPLGDQLRFLKFAGGARCQIAPRDDGEGVVCFLDRRLHGSSGLNLVHVLESSWRMVAVSSLVFLVLIWGFIVHGIPAVAHHVALLVPASVLKPLSDQTLVLLDGEFFADSMLAEEKRQEIRELFQPICTAFSPDSQCEVLFRKGGEQIGANAFALPSGQIIITDELVDMAVSVQEIEGVLAHEMAHVQERHGVRHGLQHTGVFLLISGLLGDFGSISSMAASLPILFVESGYSRKFEEESDRLACGYLLDQGRAITPYQDILVRMTTDSPVTPSLLASHPETRRRVALMEDFAVEYGRR